MTIKISIVGIFAVGVMAGNLVLGAIPQIQSVGPEEVLPVGTGRLSSIATDSSNQPHIIADTGGFAFFYDKINGAWRFLGKNMGSIAGAAQYYNPHIEIDAADRAWYTGVILGRKNGLGLAVRTDMVSNPSDFGSISIAQFANVFDVGNHSVDPAMPGNTIVSGDNGQWQRYQYNAAVPSKSSPTAQSGRLYAGNGGEKNNFWVSKAGAVLHPDGSTRSVFHGATGGYSKSPSGYQNTIRQARGEPHITWAAYAANRTQQDDGTYPRVVSDARDPQIAYIISDFSTGYKYGNTAGVAMNIWNGNTGKFKFSTSTLLQIDRFGTSGLRRYAPSMAPAKDGGVWVTWMRDARVKIRYVPSDAGSINDCGPEIDVAAGNRPSVAVDNRGDIHVAFNRSSGGMGYKKVTISSSVGGVTRPVDFSGDGGDDIAVYNDKTFRWTIQSVNPNTSLLWSNQLFGASNAAPLAGYFTSTNKATIGYYEPKTAKWTIRNTYSNATLALNAVVFGAINSIPVIGDFNGDGLDDLCVFNPQTYRWSIRTMGGTVLANNIQHGFAGVVPVAGDFNDDGIDDLGVYNPANGKWYVRSIAGSSLVWDFQWGTSAMLPVVRDYNEDEVADLGLYDTRNSRWYVVDSMTKDLIYGHRKFGDGNAQPTPGQYLGDSKTLHATYQPSQGQWSILAAEGESLQSLSAVAALTPVPGDYFGTGTKTMAMYEENTGTWRIKGSNGVVVIQHGFPGAKPVVGDYNNDGRDDLAVYSAGRWFIRSVTGAVLAWNLDWGFPGAVAVPGDYNNDGRSDLAVYAEATGRWYIRRLTGQVIAWNLQHGFPGGMALPGNFGGDGSSDMAIVNRNTGRWIIRTVGGQIIEWNRKHGFTGAHYLTGDIDDDGKDDLIAYGRTGTGFAHKWFVWEPSVGPLNWAETWGMADATPFVDNGKFSLLQQDRTWYTRNNINSMLNITVPSGQPNAIPIGTTSL